MKTADFDYTLHKELIAHQPAEKRDHSRLMVLNRDKQTIEHKHFYDLPEYLSPGDLLVLNDTKVIPGNLVGRKEDGGARVEALLVSRKPKAMPTGRQVEHRAQVWECLVKPGKRLNVGSRVVFGHGEVVGTVLEKTESGEQIIEFEGEIEKYMQRKGEIPLPPYIKKAESRTQKAEHRERYQTVYAEKEGASAAPTAGLHFTPQLLKKIKAKGIQIAYVTLHTGLATFKPVYAENIEDHKMYSESFEVPEETIEAIRRAGRVIAVGTTSVRALETQKLSGETDIFIYPGYKFKVVDAMVTNFHWPRTTLIMLVSAFAQDASADKSAFAGRDFILRAYREAIEQQYRFFSFGDAMLII